MNRHGLDVAAVASDMQLTCAGVPARSKNKCLDFRNTLFIVRGRMQGNADRSGIL